MVAWCKVCKRPVNQYCDRCGESFGTIVCEKYACGGTMMCPICGSKELGAMSDAEFGPDPYDYSKKSKEERIADSKVKETPKQPAQEFESTPAKCPMCGFDLQSNWKFCPNCGVSFGLKK
jgi:hypothetical protein